MEFLFSFLVKQGCSRRRRQLPQSLMAHQYPVLEAPQPPSSPRTRGTPETFNTVLRFDYVSTEPTYTTTPPNLSFYRCFFAQIHRLLTQTWASSLTLRGEQDQDFRSNQSTLGSKYALRQRYRHRRCVARGASSEIPQFSERGGSLPVLGLDHGASPSAKFPFRTYLGDLRHTKSWRCLWIVHAGRIGC